MIPIHLKFRVACFQKRVPVPMALRWAAGGVPLAGFPRFEVSSPVVALGSICSAHSELGKTLFLASEFSLGTEVFSVRMQGEESVLPKYGPPLCAAFPQSSVTDFQNATSSC